MSIWVTPDPDVVEAEVRRQTALERRAQAITRNLVQSNGARPADTYGSFVGRLNRWVNTAPWVPPGAVLGLAEAGIDPDTGAGRALMANHLAIRGLAEHWAPLATGRRPLELPPPARRVATPGGPTVTGPADPRQDAPSDRAVADEWDALSDGERRRMRLMLEEAAGWTFEEADNLLRYARNNGIGVETVANQVGRDLLDNRSFGTPADFLRDATKDRPGLWEQASAPIRGLARWGLEQSGYGQHNLRTGTSADTNRSSAPYMELTEPGNVMGLGLDAVSDSVGGVTRPTFMALDSGMQVVQAAFRRGIDEPLGQLGDLPGMLTGTDVPLPPVWGEGSVLGETDLGITLERWSAGEDVDLGGGFFPETWDTENNEIGRTRHRRELEHGDVGGHAITMGRWLANRVFEEDTLPFNIVSGAVDATVAVVNPLDKGIDMVVDANRARRAVSTWRTVDDVATNPRFVQAETIIRSSTRGTSLEGIGVHETLERYLRLPDEVRQGMRSGARSAPDGVFANMTVADRRLIAEWGDELEETFGAVTARRPWISAVDEDTTDPLLLSGGGVRARDTGDSAATGTFAQASLDEAAAARWDARQGLTGGDVPDLPAHQLTLDEFARSPHATAEHLDDAMETVTTRHRRFVADAIDRGDPVPATVLFDHPDLVPPDRLRQLVEVDAGVIADAWRPDVVRTRFDSWLDSKQGSGVLSAMADTTDVYDVWRMTGRRYPLHIVRQLADLTDPELIADLLRRHAGVELRDMPSTGLGLVDRTTDALRHGADPLTLRGRVKLAAARQLSSMPNAVVDTENLDDAAGVIERWMTNAAMPDDRIRRVFDRLARVANPEEVFPIVQDEMAGALRQLLRDMGVDREHANRLTRMMSDRVSGDRQWAVNDAGNHFVPKAVLDGDAVGAPGPMLASELVNRYIPLPADARDIRRALSPFRRIVSNPVARVPHGVALWLQENLWKPLTLLRPAWPVRVVGEEQVRLAAGGLDSLFRDPLGYMAILASRRLHEGLLGDPLKLVDEHTRAMSQMGGLSNDAGRFIARDMTRIGGFVRLGPNDDGFVTAWANELVRLSHDPVARHVHNYGVGDETVEWFMRGGGREHRELMMVARPELADVDEARRFLDGVAERIAHATRHDTELDEILRTGRLPGEPPAAQIRKGGRVHVEGLDRPAKVLEVDPSGSVTVEHVTRDGEHVIRQLSVHDVTPVNVPRGLTLGSDDVGLNPEFVAMLSRRADGPTAPRYMVGEDVRFVANQGPKARRAVDTMFHWLGSTPTNKLSRSPAFRQFYWKRAVELVPYMTDDARAEALAQARRQGVDGGTLIEIEAITARSVAGDIDLAVADEMSRLAALDDTKRLLFDMSERRQFFDTFRLMFPFGDAWAEVVTRWARLASTNPLTARRLEQGITTGRSQGWFEEGAYGDEVFNYGPTRWAPEFLGFPDAQMQGRLAGLNLMGEVFPGFGFAVQVPATLVWSDNADRQGWLEVIAPYGGAETFQQTFVPPHVRGFLTGFLAEDGWATWLPDDLANGLTEGGRYLGLTDPVRFERMRKDVMDYLVTTEGWPTSTLDEQEALLAEAGRRASVFMMARGFAQSILPTTPIPEWEIGTDIGMAVKAELMDEWYELQAEDPDNAMSIMLDRYGEDIWLVLQGKTRGVSLNAPITATPLEWVRRHPELVDRYPMVYGLFAPQATEAEDIDPQAFERVLRTGGRENLTARQMLALGQDRLAWSIYNAERDQFGDRLAPHEARYMRDVEEWLLEEYPGWQTAIGTTDRADTEQLIRQLQAAVEDPVIAETPAGQGTIMFLEGWDEATEAGRDLSTASIPFASSAATAHLRAFVRDHAEWTISQHPEFEPVWRMVFERALADEDDEEVR